MRAAIILGATAGLVLGCWRHDPNHCGSNLGDASCPSGMFCNGCEAENNGCVAEQPSLTCHIAQADDDSGGGSSGTTTITTSATVGSGTASTGGETDSPASSTGDAGCVSDGECLDPGAPFCGAQGECVSCDGVGDPDGACAGLNALAPVCAGGVCVQCTAEQTGACDGQTPVCGASNECVACTEHAQCPQSACHLDGELRGACFDPTEVVMIANTTELTDALANVGERAVFVLAAGSYATSVQIGGTTELAVLGAGGPHPVITGDSFRAVELFGEALLYLSGVQVSNIAGNGLDCSGAAVWLDDSLVRNNGLGVSVTNGCQGSVRRSLIVNNASGGIDLLGGALSMQNSVVGLNGDVVTSMIGGLRFDSAELEISYSSIIGNQSTDGASSSVWCISGVTGQIRNSLLLGLGDSVDTCPMVDFANNAVDDPGLGGTNEDLGPVMAAWFVNLAMSDFHLSAAGQTAFDGLALWQPGDPMLDADGDPIPMRGPSHPGYDQP